MEILSKLKKTEKKFYLSQTQYIAFGFFILIAAGTVLLMLPVSSNDGCSISFLDALFTSASASCVTGLVVVDTWTQWSLFGRIVILCLIQIGGLGFVTIGIGLSIFLRRKIGLREMGLMQESINTLQIGGMARLAKEILIGTFIFEGAGALLLAIRFVPQFGAVKGLFYGLFHSVSAFCNAGFDLLGEEEAYGSFTGYYGDCLVNLVLMSLIVIGGIGFIVWDDLRRNKLNVRKYSLHTKMVLIATVILIFGGAAVFYFMERRNLFSNMGTGSKILSSLFASVTARTAGFNTIDTGSMTDGSKLMTLILMFIGGSPGSTAGGVKTTTVFALFFYVRAEINRTYGTEVMGRRIHMDVVRRAAAICTINLTLALTASLLIMAWQPFTLSETLFETISAISTVGMSTGITRQLLPASKIVIILLMYSGRIGSMSFALAFTQNKKKAHVENPAEMIMVG